MRGPVRLKSKSLMYSLTSMRHPRIPRFLRPALVLIQIVTWPLVAYAAAAPAFLAATEGAGVAADEEKGVHNSLTYSFATGVPLFGGAIASVVLPGEIYKTPPGCRWCGGATSNVIDRWARQARWSDPCRAVGLSYWTVGAAAAVALGPASHESRGSDWLVNAGTIVDSVAATVILTQVVKYTVRRERPSKSICHPDHKTETDRNLSFFSGHTAVAFALVSSAREVARLRGREPDDWLWAGGFAAAATGYLRVAGDRHHLVDIVAGAAVGTLIGTWVPRGLHRASRANSSHPSPAQARPQSSWPSLYSRPITSGNRTVLLQVGKGPGHSLQVGFSF